MTDIVERLLKRGANALLIKEKPDLHYDAVYEIERLRLELDMAQATILVPSQKDDRRTIERLRAKNERLREALEPFAYYADLIPDGISDTCSASGTVGDLRAARKALGETE